uniref:Uncharacterized protein n=1 Tax=Ditylenchus dipsaci TaxID=166011 RepID=A0A915D7D0_9BILA
MLWNLNKRSKNAVGLYRDDELLFEHPFITATVINRAPEVLEIDPTFKVDLSGCEVTADERYQLGSLVKEFDDVFSKSRTTWEDVKWNPVDQDETETPVRQGYSTNV